jgi:hypothetical protein
MSASDDLAERVRAAVAGSGAIREVKMSYVNAAIRGLSRL